MLWFESDYTVGAHPAVLAALVATNGENLASYGADVYTLRAKEKIRAACGGRGEVYLLAGGTQTNMLTISAMLASHEGVIAAETGHVASHEAGAIEHTGHKVLTLPHSEGKISAAQVDAFVEAFYADPVYAHMVHPGMVYISQPTEYGTLYSLAELEALRAVCDRRGLPLYCDGARLGYALACPENDVSMADLARLCDAFYIGGTKVGALCGEALVFREGAAPRAFLTYTKQEGAMLCKGRLTGVQFDALFTDGLYEKIGSVAIGCAAALRRALREKGYAEHIAAPTNQIFVRMTREKYEQLRPSVAFSFWEPLDAEMCVVRFVTSWATRPEDVEQLCALL
ncbi:MAG: low specificity L-threonine aldolase [Clostridia bacterium]|nr:low specificity L-threonine aldolase [Clostridia bacterium]